MNILFANLHWDYGEDHTQENMKPLQFPTGLAIIAAEIRKHRNDNLFTIDNYVANLKDEDVFDFMADHSVDCVLLSLFLGNYQYRYLKKFVNKHNELFPSCKIIIGGPMATTIPHLILKNTKGDDEQVICVIGEGEGTIIDLLSCFDSKDNLSRVKGICFKRGQEIIQTEARPRLKNLDDHPYLAYDLFETQTYADYVNSTNRCWELCTSRGCFGSCVYCKLVFGRKITMKSAKSVLNEMIDFYKSYGINRFNFVDDNFLNTEKQIWDFYNALRKCDIKFKWRFQGRADRLHPSLASALVEVGLYDISFGIESGSIIIHKEMNKKLNLDRARTNLKLLPSELDTHASFIIGMPRESHETIEQSIEFIRDVGVKNINAGILTLFPDTVLYEMARSKGIIKNEDEYCDNLGPVYVYPYINLTAYPDEQLIKWAEMVSNAGSVNKAKSD